MTRSRHTRKALGLCVFAICLLALPAGAQAGEWMVNGVKDSSWAAGLKPTLTAEFVGGKRTLLAAVAGVKMELTCTKVELVGVSLEKGGKLTVGGKGKFTGCALLINGKASSCEPHSVGSPVGTIVATFTGEIGQQEKAPVPSGLAQPVPKEEKKEESKTPFVTVSMGEECAIGEEVPITGMYGFRDVVGEEFETEKVTHEVEEYAPNSSLTVLGNPATIDGATLIKLTGEHAGLKFSALK